ncbi:oxygen-dependent protoporphyrinogen oxidase [Didymella pomorum]|uniref:Protoporphyrinogen oxidase n=1 Tax=Didymella pomorum TaxID=749634 RepID=A0A9W9D329_9PLEO|nr:oxygen-dependent protoporphyrinogen oxidase [Didymella pomorum]
MLVRRHAPLLQSTVRAHVLRPLLTSQCTRLPHLRYSSSAAHPERIAVLGGGIAGLASAFFASREFPNSKITVYEGGKDIGGWLNSKRVQVPGGDVLFEAGPRTLRNASPTAHLIQELGITDDLIFTKKSEPGAKNRFIYYPDRLNRLPSEAPGLGDLFSLWRTGILDGFVGMIKEPMKPKRSSTLSDETVGSFLARRVDERIANNIISAVFHGIYAGDIWQLSAKTLLGLGWQLEGRYGTALGGYLKMQNESTNGQPQALAHPYDVEAARAMNEEIDISLELAQNMKEASMFTWKDGLQTLVKGLKNAMEKTGNIEIKLNSPVSSFKMAEGGEQKVEIIAGSDANKTTEHYDTVISTLRHPDITPYVTVMTVNLFFSNPSLLPVEGFGYLLPQSIPFEQNPERALGVIFDNSAVRGQDTAPGTKMTVMMGGHWWNGFDGFPDEEEGLAMARSVIERHLGITDEPVAHHVNLSKDCIPQYTLGYEDRLRTFASSIQDEFKGRLRVVGAQFNGVGVNDCITGAWNVARGLRGDGWKGRNCGLERVMDQRPWQVVDATSMVYKKKVRAEEESDPLKG